MPTETTPGVAVTLVRRSPRTVIVRLPDGTERKINGRYVSMVYCKKADIDDQIKQTPNRQVEVFATLHGDMLMLFGQANWI